MTQILVTLVEDADEDEIADTIHRIEQIGIVAEAEVYYEPDFGGEDM